MSAISLLLILLTFELPTVDGELCERLNLDGISDGSLPVLHTEGVYRRTGLTWDEMPVLKQELGDLYCYYNKSLKAFYFGRNRSLSSGLAITAADDVRPELLSGDTPYRRVTKFWYYYDFASSGWYQIGPSGRLDLRCVDDSYRTCGADTFYFSDTVQQEKDDVYINILAVHNFTRVPGMYSQHRAVYVRNEDTAAGALYLYYHAPYWCVGSDLTTPLGVMRVESTALRPEVIRGVWHAYSGQIYETKPLLNLLCQGLPLDTGCDISTCQNGGTCYTSRGAVHCACPRSHGGLRCERELPVCQPPDLDPNSAGRGWSTLSEGGIASHVCKTGYEPKHYFSVCAVVPNGGGIQWLDEGSCLRSTTPTTRPTTTLTTTAKRPTTTTTYGLGRPSSTNSLLDNFVKVMDSFWFMIVFLILVVCLGTFLGCFIHCCISITASRKKSDASWAKRAAILKTQRFLDALSQFTRTHGDDPDQYDPETRAQYDILYAKVKSTDNEGRIPSISGARNRHSQLGDATDQAGPDIETGDDPDEDKGKKEWWRKKFSCCRTQSMVSAVSFWLWVVFLVGCSATSCRSVSETLNALYITGAVFVALNHMWVLVECWISREYQYLTNLGEEESATTITDNIKQAEPTVMFSCEAYHYETRTREVRHTDSRGITHYRTESYQEKVVTHTAEERFIFARWRDFSESNVTGIRGLGLTLIRLEESVRCGDAETQNNFEEKKLQFHNRNKNKDTYVNFGIRTDIPGFVKRIAAYADSKTVPWWIRKWVFWIVSILGFSWLWRIAFRKSTHKTEFQVEKRIYLSPRQDAANMSSFEHADKTNHVPTAPPPLYETLQMQNFV